jgi:hypothetical protein
MTIAENLEWQRLFRKGPKFLGRDDFGTERAVVFHVPVGKGKTNQIRDILERREQSLILSHRTTLTDDIYHSYRATTYLKHYSHDFKVREQKYKMADTN